MDKLERMKELVKTINFHNYNYYSLDNPTISDAEWDKLYDELLLLERETGMVLPASPTKRVGGEMLEEFVKKEHKVPLYSLEKCNQYDKLKDWVENVKKAVKNAKFYVEYKYDGLSIAIKYKNGELVEALTRGNGAIGEDITAQAKTIRTVPLSIDFKGELVVQGECIMKLSELEKYNQTAQEPLKNARNGAAGALRNLDPKVTKSRNLDVVFYAVNYAENVVFNTQEEMYYFLKEHKFNVEKNISVLESYEDIENAVKNIDSEKYDLDFLIDGAVLKLNNIKSREIFGYTSKFPKWAIAFKFEAQELSTKLNDVVWQVGRTGKITPIGLIEPVVLAGATIKKATLNNYGDIIRKKVKINCYVFVRRSNEVIPEILGVAHYTDEDKEIIAPTICPSCGAVLKEVGANLFCPNYECPAQIKDRITHFVSRDAFNIDGVSEKTVEQLYNECYLRSVVDLYGLTKEQLLGLEGFKDKKADNFITELNKSKNIPLERFIYALGISNIGKKSAKDLVKHFKSLNALMNASLDELNSIFDFGDIMAQNVYDFFRDSKNLNVINQLLQIGVSPIESAHKLKSQKFENCTFVLTGTLPNLSRDEATKIIEENGGKTSSSVSKNTSYVLVGEDAGSKLDKARKLGVKELNESEFIKMLE